MVFFFKIFYKTTCSTGDIYIYVHFKMLCKVLSWFSAFVTPELSHHYYLARGPLFAHPCPTPKLQLTLESRLTANSPSGNTWKASVAKSELVTDYYASLLAQPGWPRLCSANFSAEPGLQCRGIRRSSLVPQHPH